MVQRRTRARIVLYSFFLIAFIFFVVFVRRLVVNIHPEIGFEKKENIFQVKSPDDLNILYQQFEDLTAEAIDMKDIVLVTGGSGFICSHVVDTLLFEGYQVIVMDRTVNATTDGTRENWKIKKGKGHVPSFIHIQGDMCNPKDLELIPNIPIKYVFHCAGVPPPAELSTASHDYASYFGKPPPDLPPSEFNPERFSERQKATSEGAARQKQVQDEFNERHVTSTRNLVNLFANRDYPVLRFLVISSTDVYGPLAVSSLPFVRRRKHAPPNPWAQSKKNMESFISNVVSGRSSMIKSFGVVRPTAVYGPRQSDGFIKNTIRAALKNEPIILPMNGLFTRDFIYVSNLAESIVKILTLPRGFVEFNIGSGLEYNLNDFVNTAIVLTGSKSEIKYEYSVLPDITHQLVKVTPVSPERPLDFDEGLKLTIKAIAKELEDEERLEAERLEAQKLEA